MSSLLLYYLLTSMQIAQDDEGFEIASFGGSLDEEDARSPTYEANGALSPVPPKPVNDNAPKKALSEASSYKKRSQQIELEQKLLYATYSELKQWFEERLSS